ncbi:Differentially expressed in FDCP 6 -like protein [Triplophysa tibetana]|uniref:Differentially expressed in FDCP 6-like protein n=1 Tax=Triplophysa tibetana TaxID=1572043 RepID=A0A5A9PGW6_9TELE|nr:Differentially expressed in FDCP 6 -like protein [Triplophysa tibetana]
MDLKSELLKSIWYAFTSLDVEQCGKVSKSQLKVLSHNLYTALNIPHDPVALEEHFKDNNNGPVSSHGYMPYINQYILAKATEGTFNKEIFDELCWMMSSKKNCKVSVYQGLCSQRDCFKLFCLFNLLSEDRYPLVIIHPELEYLLKKISCAMSPEWDGSLLDDLLSQNSVLQDGMSVWEFLEHLSAGRLLHVESKESFGLALDDVFTEMYHNIIKKGYLLKKGHVRRNWQERWFVLKPSSLTYFVSEELKEKKGEVALDENCVVENLPDKEGRRCLFCMKTPMRMYEMSASNMKQRVDWIQAIQMAFRLRAEGKSSLHQDLKLSRRKQREAFQRSHSNQSNQNEPIADEKQHPSPEQHNLEQHIDSIIQTQREVEAKRKEEERQQREEQQGVQKDLRRQLQEANEDRERMVTALTDMEKEVHQQKKRIQELELTQQKLEEALNTQIHARLEEDRIRQDLERQLAEEQMKLADLLLLQSQRETLAVRSLEEQLLDDSAPVSTSPSNQELEESSREYAEEANDQAVASTPTPPDNQPAEENCQHQMDKELGTQSTNNLMLKHWKIQLNSLMKPITPGDKVEHLPIKPSCPRQGQALISTEFISKVQTGIPHEKGNGYNPSPLQEEEE